MLLICKMSWLTSAKKGHNIYLMDRSYLFPYIFKWNLYYQWNKVMNNSCTFDMSVFDDIIFLNVQWGSQESRPSGKDYVQTLAFEMWINQTWYFLVWDLK